jgi:two-component system copper resistance phosphate regulon response regulator CusR
LDRVRILIVEDEPKVGRALQEGLEAAGYEAAVAATGEEGFYRAQTEAFDLIILDRLLPGRDGLEVLGSLRRASVPTPVLLLTARDAVEDRVQGLDAGADDYLVKPFAFPELLARIRVALRRGGHGTSPARLTLGTLEMEPASRRVSRGGTALDLTPREYELLEYLMRHRGRLVSREMLTHEVWKEPRRGTPLDNVIDVHVARLRKKIDQGQPTRLIHTVRGVGFVLREGDP